MDINKIDRWGNTPLVKAIGKKDLAAVRTLIENGADVNMANKKGKLPLQKAMDVYNIDILWELIQAGADCRKINSSWDTPVYLVVERQYGITGIKYNRDSMSLVTEKLVSLMMRDDFRSVDINRFAEYLQKNSRISYSEIAAFALLAAAAIYPDSCSKLDEMISKKRSVAIDFAFENLPDFFPCDNILAVLSRGKKLPIGESYSKKSLKKLVSVLSEVLDSNPMVAMEFFFKRIGRHVEEWSRRNVPGADTLIAKLSSRFREMEKSGILPGKNQKGEEDILEDMTDIFF